MTNKQEKKYVVFVFQDGHQTLAAEEALLAAGIQCEIVLLPTELGLGCGTALKVPQGKDNEAEQAFAAADVKSSSLWQMTGDQWANWQKIRC